jgi:hypothetical protein
MKIRIWVRPFCFVAQRAAAGGMVSQTGTSALGPLLALLSTIVSLRAATGDPAGGVDRWHVSRRSRGTASAQHRGVAGPWGAASTERADAAGACVGPPVQVLSVPRGESYGTGADAADTRIGRQFRYGGSVGGPADATRTGAGGGVRRSTSYGAAGSVGGSAGPQGPAQAGACAGPPITACNFGRKTGMQPMPGGGVG